MTLIVKAALHTLYQEAFIWYCLLNKKDSTESPDLKMP